MPSDLKEDIIQLMQRTRLVNTPFTELSGGEKEAIYELLRHLTDEAIDENYTLLDYMQMARLHYNLGVLYSDLFGEVDNSYYKRAVQDLVKGGFDLSINKWFELISLRTIE